MGVKGSWQRPGEGYAEGWDAIYGKKERIDEFGDWPKGKEHICGLGGEHYGICPACEKAEKED